MVLNTVPLDWESSALTIRPFSDYTEILAGFPQGSIFVPLLFNVFLKCIFLFTTFSNLGMYEDDNSLTSSNVINNSLPVIKSNLEANFAIMKK